MVPGVLVERSRERAAISAAVSQLDAAAGVVVLIEGEAGVGKSALLHDAIASIERAQIPVIRAAAVALERDFGYGVVRQLLEPTLTCLSEEQRAVVLGGPALPASPVFGLPLPPPAAAFGYEGDPAFVVCHGLFWVLRHLTANEPLVVVVDDAHWADGASLRWLAHVARRLEGLPVLLLVSSRTGERVADEDAYAQLRSAAGERRLRLGALSPDGVGQLATHVLGDAGTGFGAACHERTGGNPLFVHELLLAAQEEEILDAPDLLAALDRLGARHAADRAMRRLDRASEPARHLAFAVAILDRAQVHEAAALAGLEIEVAECAADELLDAGILTVARPLRFVHPLLRDAVESRLAPGRRSSSHRRAAVLLSADPARLDEAATHLLHCDPVDDPWVVDVLSAAAERTVKRGAHDAAVVLLRRAIEEPAGDRRDVLLAALGRSETRSGE
ncbi:MAG: AAA family ATPase, partial [Actinobacteria bacterium]|nr:AAA family ATPase [Actinomycetota bacterium]MCA1698360.1 AAA family ATPase [Actinomycetota bacterium]